MPKVSLYIPCFNAEKTIQECLESVMRQSFPIDEVLIIDDGCQDKTADIVSKYPVKIIKHDKNKGLAASRNSAFKQAQNEFVAALDADCLAYNDWLKELLGCFEDENVAGSGGRLRERHYRKLADQWRLAHMQQNWGEAYLKDALFIYGSNSVFRKSRLERIGFYNDHDFRNHYEDVDLSERLHRKGYRLAYNPAAQAEHLRTDTINSLLKNYWRWSGQAHINSYNARHPLRRIIARLLLIAETCGKFLEADMVKKNYRLLFLDLIFPLYFLWLDTICFLRKIIRKRSN
ncbi:MAG: glycosyltransferase [Candidatus Omnitrophica bacterium]|jgi:cellulose synthase/poly-beta-1,6-N-acetylglucosamine synthase-like glycosyltransferase|nr:glycosyltransferase [Candidatus Omnitrophota bacterium]